MPTVHRIHDRLTPLIAKFLEPPGGPRSDLWLIPLEDHTQTECSKNYRRSVNVQFTFRARDRHVVAVGDAWTGNRNDIVVFRATMAGQVADHRLTIGDGAPGSLLALFARGRLRHVEEDMVDLRPSPTSYERASRPSR